MAKDTAATNNLPFGCGSRIFVNGPSAADNSGYSCIGPKTRRSTMECEHDSVKTKQGKPATHPLLCHEKTFPPVHSILALKPCPPPRQMAAHRCGCCEGLSAGGRLSGWGVGLRKSRKGAGNSLLLACHFYDQTIWLF